ncbi:kinase-like protein [Lizonia empirigonia]|nr:kinase-like protein [Lizonia empirigonia]
MAIDERIIGIGGSAIVSAHDEKTVLKGYYVVHNGRLTTSFCNVERSQRSLNVEYQAYQRLGQHKNILKCFGWVEVQPGAHSLRLEFASQGNLRSYIETTNSSQVGLSVRLSWAIDLAAGLAHIHSQRVFHCDFSCRNVVLTEQNIVKVCDFGGAGLDSEVSDGVEEPRYELPLRGRDWEARPYMKRDLFALGSSIYEIMAWKKPFAELTDGEVEKFFNRDEFPDVSNIPCADIIRKCWNEEYERAEDVMLVLQAVMIAQKD